MGACSSSVNSKNSGRSDGSNLAGTSSLYAQPASSPSSIAVKANPLLVRTSSVKAGGNSSSPSSKCNSMRSSPTNNRIVSTNMSAPSSPNNTIRPDSCGKNMNRLDDTERDDDNNSTASRNSDTFVCGDDEFINWSDIRVNAPTAEEAILGTGSFGTVIRATFRKPDSTLSSNATSYSPSKNNKTKKSTKSSEIDVAVKVLIRSTGGNNNSMSDEDFNEIVKKAIQETFFLQETARTIGNTDRIVKAYGVAKGNLPLNLIQLFNLEGNMEEDGDKNDNSVTPVLIQGIGIVMRYEGGGSLMELLYKGVAIPLQRKLFILKGIAHGLAELHAVGVVHADIKPDNVLLSSGSNPQVRLADFGMSLYQDLNIAGSTLSGSSLMATTHLRGTPVYCAPEMLINPFGDFDGTVAKSSRKTDMYAFAMLSWEVLTQERPFLELKSEGALCARVHKNHRPPMQKVPEDVPLDVMGMIELCWDRDRSQRLSAVECLTILYYQYELCLGSNFDIFLSHTKAMRPFLSHVAHLLLQRGFRIWYDQAAKENTNEKDNITRSQHAKLKNQSVHDSNNSSNKNAATTTSAERIESSTMFIACVDKVYQGSLNCMNELRIASLCGNSNKGEIKPSLIIVLEENPTNWMNDELSRFCSNKSKHNTSNNSSTMSQKDQENNSINTNTIMNATNGIFDLSHLQPQRWNTEEGPNNQQRLDLQQALTPIIAYLIQCGCLDKRGGVGRNNGSVPVSPTKKIVLPTRNGNNNYQSNFSSGEKSRKLNT